MLILGIESSCDETAAAVVENGARILSSVVASQNLTHEKYGGVVPELASREHLKRIVPVVEEALLRANIGLDQVEGIAVTEGPGLVGSLLVGLVYGKSLALATGKPLIGINHLEGHIQSVLLQNEVDADQGKADGQPDSLAVALVVSGGHTSLFLVERTLGGSADSAPRFSYKPLGSTRDDAGGEAFDKVAKLLALGYPGGPIIDRLSRFGNPAAVDFGRIRMKRNPLDFSYSGLKTAVLYRIRGTALETEAADRRAWRKIAHCATWEDVRGHCSSETLDLVASFQNAVVTDLVERTLVAADREGAATILVSGGVACNSLLRERFCEASSARKKKVFFPSPALSTDNAAMIAAAAYYQIEAGVRADASLTAHASFPLLTTGR